MMRPTDEYENGASRQATTHPQHSRTPTQRGAINHNRIQNRGREGGEGVGQSVSRDNDCRRFEDFGLWKDGALL